MKREYQPVIRPLKNWKYQLENKLHVQKKILTETCEQNVAAAKATTAAPAAGAKSTSPQKGSKPAATASSQKGSQPAATTSPQKGSKPAATTTSDSKSTKTEPAPNLNNQ